MSQDGTYVSGPLNIKLVSSMPFNAKIDAVAQGMAQWLKQNSHKNKEQISLLTINEKSVAEFVNDSTILPLLSRKTYGESWNTKKSKEEADEEEQEEEEQEKNGENGEKKPARELNEALICQLFDYFKINQHEAKSINFNIRDSRGFTPLGVAIAGGMSLAACRLAEREKEAYYEEAEEASEKMLKRVDPAFLVRNVKSLLEMAKIAGTPLNADVRVPKKGYEKNEYLNLYDLLLRYVFSPLTYLEGFNTKEEIKRARDYCLEVIHLLDNKDANKKDLAVAAFDVNEGSQVFESILSRFGLPMEQFTGTGGDEMEVTEAFCAFEDTGVELCYWTTSSVLANLGPSQLFIVLDILKQHQLSYNPYKLNTITGDYGFVPSWALKIESLEILLEMGDQTGQKLNLNYENELGLPFLNFIRDKEDGNLIMFSHKHKLPIDFNRYPFKINKGQLKRTKDEIRNWATTWDLRKDDFPYNYDNFSITVLYHKDILDGILKGEYQFEIPIEAVQDLVKAQSYNPDRKNTEKVHSFLAYCDYLAKKNPPVMLSFHNLYEWEHDGLPKGPKKDSYPSDTPDTIYRCEFDLDTESEDSYLQYEGFKRLKDAHTEQVEPQNSNIVTIPEGYVLKPENIVYYDIIAKLIYSSIYYQFTILPNNLAVCGKAENCEHCKKSYRQYQKQIKEKVELPTFLQPGEVQVLSVVLTDFAIRGVQNYEKFRLYVVFAREKGIPLLLDTPYDHQTLIEKAIENQQPFILLLNYYIEPKGIQVNVSKKNDAGDSLLDLANNKRSVQERISERVQKKSPCIIIDEKDKYELLRIIGSNDALKYVDEHPNDPDALCFKARVFIDRNRTEDALKVLDDLIVSHHNMSEAYYQKALVLKNYTPTPRFEEALDNLNEAVTYDANNPLYDINRIEVLLKLERREEAGRIIEELKLKVDMSQGLFSQAQRNLLYKLSILSEEYCKMSPKVQAEGSVSEKAKQLVIKVVDNFNKKAINSLQAKDLEQNIEEINTKIQQLSNRITNVEDDNKIAGVTRKAEVIREFQDLKQNHREFYEYAKAFYWTLLNYFCGYRALSTELMKGDPDLTSNPTEEKAVWAVSKIVSKVLDKIRELGESVIKGIPIAGSVINVLDTLVDQVYGSIKEQRLKSRINAINSIIVKNEHMLLEDELSLYAASAAVKLARRRREEKVQFVIIGGTESALLTKLKALQTSFYAKMGAEEISVYSEIPAQIALQDVVCLLGYLYTHHAEIVANKTEMLDDQLVRIVFGQIPYHQKLFAPLLVPSVPIADTQSGKKSSCCEMF